MAMHEFVTAAKKDGAQRQETSEPISFLHDGREVTFYEPTSAQLVMMSTLRASRDPSMREITTLMNFFFGMMDEDTADYFQDRMMDPTDILSDIEAEGGMIDVMDYLMTEWSGKVEKQPSDFQPSRKATGRSSTASSRAKGSTSSRSRSTASSTSSKRS